MAVYVCQCKEMSGMQQLNVVGLIHTRASNGQGGIKAQNAHELVNVLGIQVRTLPQPIFHSRYPPQAVSVYHYSYLSRNSPRKLVEIFMNSTMRGSAW